MNHLILTVRSVINMCPRTPEQFQEIRETARKKILASALDLFSSLGFTQTSVQEIAHRAGISKGSIYTHFESKEDILKVIFKTGFSELYRDFDPDHDGVLTRQEMEEYIRKFFTLLQEKPGFWKLYYAIATQPGIFDLIRNDFSPGESTVNILRNYFRMQGYADPNLELSCFISLMEGVSMNFLFNPDHFPLAEVISRIVDQYCNDLPGPNKLRS